MFAVFLVFCFILGLFVLLHGDFVEFIYNGCSEQMQAFFSRIRFFLAKWLYPQGKILVFFLHALPKARACNPL